MMDVVLGVDISDILVTKHLHTCGPTGVKEKTLTLCLLHRQSGKCHDNVQDFHQVIFTDLA